MIKTCSKCNKKLVEVGGYVRAGKSITIFECYTCGSRFEINVSKEKGINLLKNSTGLMPESYACGYMSVDVINSAQESSSFRGW